MFNYDKIVKKLGKFDELSEKKQKKVLSSVLCSEEFNEWFYGIGDARNNHPFNQVMVQKLFNLMSRPIIVKGLTTFIEEVDGKSFNHTSAALVSLIIDQGVESLNKANSEISDESKTGTMSNKELKVYKDKSEKYTEYIASLLASLKERCHNDIKDIYKSSRLPKNLVYSTYFLVPSKNMIPKYKTSMYVNQILKEVYKYTANNGMESIDSIRWEPFFGAYFGNDMISSVAVSILLEGVKRIDEYRSAEFFNDVSSIWDSLTYFALSELDNASENVRKQMIELYIKKVGKIFRNGNNPRLRINILDIPNQFNNLFNTVSRYSDRISSITKMGMKPVLDIKQKYINDDEDVFELKHDGHYSDLDKFLEKSHDFKKTNKNEDNDDESFESIDDFEIDLKEFKNKPTIDTPVLPDMDDSEISIDSIDKDNPPPYFEDDKDEDE